MIRLRSRPLPRVAAQNLALLQANINQLPAYRDRVAAAKREFARQNRPTNRTFAAIRLTLTKMCSGAQRCGYCEDSFADEVEHIKPKDLYPEEVFSWQNYLYACGPCNGPKNKQYAVFSARTRALTVVTRRYRQRVTEPEPGSDVLLNPRREDSLRFMEIDLLDTFFFLPTAPRGSRDYERADYTIRVLRLNDRDPLPKAREEAYRSYRARLVEFIERRDRGATTQQLKDLADAVQRMGHPAVWHEMKRKAGHIPELTDLFGSAPEALDW